MSSKPETKAILFGHVKRSFARESFPPKWLLVVAILAVIAGLSLANYRITAAEAKLTRFAQSVDEVCANGQAVFHNAVNVCEDAAEQSEDAAAAPVPKVILGEPENGRDGRGLADIQCVIQRDGSGLWQVTYTDNVVNGNAGPCYLPPSPK